ncbi:MAG: UvrD-helicase domain-containing protein, partial [Myxococcota bacterium]
MTNPETPAWLTAEDALCTSMVQALSGLADHERLYEKQLSDQLRDLLEQRQLACSDAVQQAAIDQGIDELERARAAHSGAHRIRDLDPARPYFGHLTLSEEGRERQVLIAKGSAVDSRLPLNVVDWRNAPISRLYYEYEQGDEWCEEIAGREREGLIAARRTLEIHGGVLQGAETPTEVARKRAGGVWELKRKADQVLERSDRRDDPEDHRLPDIVALITPSQFAVLTRPDSGVVVLKGQAGSGKTTVALHRIAYLQYQDRERFRADRILVVMFNKALQTYIHGALQDLDIEGVEVSTFHGWASSMLRAARIQARFVSGVPAAVSRLKQHPAIDRLIAARVQTLGHKLCEWLVVPDALQARWEQTQGSGFQRLSLFFKSLKEGEGSEVSSVRRRLEARVRDHARDLAHLFDDEAQCAQVLPPELLKHRAAAVAHQANRARDGAFDFEDAALLLRFGQQLQNAGAPLSRPWHHKYAHLVVDEAQDLSAPALAVLLDAADAHRSVTLAGDPAQTLYDAGAFADLVQGPQTGMELDLLPIGHRSTRPIMELALMASGHDDPALLAQTRPGNDVIWLSGDGAAPRNVASQIQAFRTRRPNALIAVLCRTRRDVDTWHRHLQGQGLSDLRTAHRNTFSFQPGTLVSNVHQVKGLEFDGVVVIEPGGYRERDRNLLHVAITRAADQ